MNNKVHGKRFIITLPDDSKYDRIREYLMGKDYKTYISVEDISNRIFIFVTYSIPVELSIKIKGVRIEKSRGSDSEIIQNSKRNGVVIEELYKNEDRTENIQSMEEWYTYDEDDFATEEPIVIEEKEKKERPIVIEEREEREEREEEKDEWEIEDWMLMNEEDERNAGEWMINNEEDEDGAPMEMSQWKEIRNQEMEKYLHRKKIYDKVKAQIRNIRRETQSPKDMEALLEIEALLDEYIRDAGELDY